MFITDVLVFIVVGSVEKECCDFCDICALAKLTLPRISLFSEYEVIGAVGSSVL